MILKRKDKYKGQCYNIYSLIKLSAWYSGRQWHEGCFGLCRCLCLHECGLWKPGLILRSHRVSIIMPNRYFRLSWHSWPLTLSVGILLVLKALLSIIENESKIFIKSRVSQVNSIWKRPSVQKRIDCANRLLTFFTNPLTPGFFDATINLSWKPLCGQLYYREWCNQLYL